MPDNPKSVGLQLSQIRVMGNQMGGVKVSTESVKPDLHAEDDALAS